MVTESGLKRNLSYQWPRWHIVLRYGMREVGHMQTGKRVYPRQREPGKWLSYLLLFLSAVVVISGVVSRGGDLTIEPAATATPIPTDAYFDETVEEREITLPSATWYALQLGAFESETAAQELGQQFVKRGAAGYVWHDGRYRTLAAVYPSREDAQAVREQLSEAHSVDSYLYQIDLPALHLLMKGMKGQLDILEAAFAHANDLVTNLQESSVAMDRQEMSGEEAAQLLNGLGEQVSTVSLRLQQRFSAPRHQTVEGLIACFEDYASFLETLDAADSDATFSMKLKRQTLSTLNHLKGVYDALGNT